MSMRSIDGNPRVAISQGNLQSKFSIFYRYVIHPTFSKSSYPFCLLAIRNLNINGAYIIWLFSLICAANKLFSSLSNRKCCVYMLLNYVELWILFFSKESL